MKIKNIFKYGILPHQNNEQKRRVFLSNFLAIVLTGLSFPYFFIFKLINAPYLFANGVLVLNIILISVLYWNHKTYYFFANSILFFASNIAVLVYADLLGRETGVQLLYISLVSVPLILLEDIKIERTIFFCFIPIFFYLLLESNHYSFISEFLIPHNYQRAVFYTIFFTAMLMNILAITFFFISFKKSNQKLVLSKEKINTTLATLQDAYTQLETTQNKLEVEYEKAALTQQQFLPDEMPEIEGYNIQHFFKGAYGVSGDFYDFRQFGFITKFVVADVMSKSLSAAFITAHLYSIYRTLVNVNTTPSEVLTIINQAFVDGRHDYEKAAAFAFDLDSQTNTITYSNACIGVAYLIRCNSITPLEYCGFMTGGQRTEVYEEKQINMKEGDILLIASDGLEDIELNDGTRFGSEKLLALIEFYIKEPPLDLSLQDYIVNHIQAIADFNSILADDIVLVIVERLKK